MNEATLPRVVLRCLFAGGVFALLATPGFSQERQASAEEKEGRFAGRLFLSVSSEANPLYGIVTINPNDGTTKKILNQPNLLARASLDGQRLAVPSLGGTDLGPGLWIYPVTGQGTAHRISEKKGIPCGWSPDGKSILAGFMDGTKPTGTWRVAVDGSGEEKSPIPEAEVVLDCSPDGRWVVTWTRSDPHHPVHVMHPYGGSERLLLAAAAPVPGYGGYISSARFSPDSHRVLFARKTPDDPVRFRRVKSAGLMTLDIDGGEPRRFFVVEGGGYPHTACWSPDGRAIAVVVVDRVNPPEVATHLALIDLDGRVLKTLPLPGPRINHVLDWR